MTSCEWPGRNQIIDSPNKACTYYLDGAHTVESIEQFVNWFLELKSKQNSASTEKNVLLFNYTGERDPSSFLKTLAKIKFDAVAFSKLEAYPNNLTSQRGNIIWHSFLKENIKEST